MADSSERVVKVEDSKGNPVYRWMLQQQPWPFVEPLKCSACTRPVSIVPTYLRRGSRVSAHFRLHEGHDEGCPLNPTRIMNNIAFGSHGLAKVMKNGTLRLTIPAHDPPTSPASTGIGGEPEDDEERTLLRVTTVRPWLPPALNSAVKVAQFLRRCDFDPDLAELFTVEYRRKRIPWSEFCYGPDDLSYGLLHDRVAAAKGRRLEHPVAVHGTVLRTGMAGTKPFAVLAARIPSGQPGRTVEVVLRSAFPTLLGEELQVGMQVLAVGAGWKIFAPHKRSVDEVQLWIKEHWYLAYWTWDKDTEQAGAPMCPPPLSPDERRDSRPPGSSASRTPSRGSRPATAPHAPGPPRATAPRDQSQAAEPPGHPAAAEGGSSDDLARLILKGYSKPDSTSQPTAVDPPPSTPVPPAVTSRPDLPMPEEPSDAIPSGPDATPGPRPQPPTPAAPLPPQPERPPLPSPPQHPASGTPVPQTRPRPEAAEQNRIRRLFARLRRDR
ncbi:hypothetical protein [Streptomyces sp. WM6378]|uniref:hypothetical protein n=1 Tax=Streptomyces sp. WM6378 TaxID=1415557 RepID=UPI0006ADB47E|nr:hypothetical protein [Streptomyces sp. WM6378]KOU43253.1 hypothetical protein ADK54_18290 [Streptomyces sp. WM6378]